MKITIYGSGYVGLVTGACLADAGHSVVCMDIEAERVARLNAGEIPIYEPGLVDIVASCTAAERLTFTTDAAAAGRFGVLQFIAVGTPAMDDGGADLRAVDAVAAQIGDHLERFGVVVTKSTVPVGTADRVGEIVATRLAARGADVAFEVASNPEFLKEGAAIEDFNRPDRIVVGTESERVRRLMEECYAPFMRSRDKLMFMDVRSAELTKYAANSMLATRISFINEMANIADAVGADITAVRKAIGADQRIGPQFLYPGAGYGGSCFPKDVRALGWFADAYGYQADLMRTVEDINNRQKQSLFRKLQAALGSNLRGRTIALWGLAFKPNTDDMREAPSRVLIERLWSEGATVRAYDPQAMNECRRLFGERPDLTLVDSKDAALEGADALVICTEWKEFRALDKDLFHQCLLERVIVDGRNLYDPSWLEGSGLTYLSVGRPPIREGATSAGAAKTAAAGGGG